MDVTNFIHQLRAEMMTTAENLPFRFLNTHERDAVEYLKTYFNCEGYSEEEVVAAEATMGRPFPLLFREFLLQMGKNQSILFSDDTVLELAEIPGKVAFLKECVQELNEENEIYCKESGETFKEVKLAIPDNAIVFMHHQGYQHFYVLPTDKEDPQTYAVNEYEDVHALGPFSNFLTDSLADRQSFNEVAHENGGWFLTLEEGATRQILPAGDVRPLDYNHDIIENRPPWIKFRHWLDSLVRRK